MSESNDVEALSVVTATHFAEELGQQCIILEVDCLRVIQALKMISPDLSLIGRLIVEVKDRLRSFLECKDLTY